LMCASTVYMQLAADNGGRVVSATTAPVVIT